MSIMPRFRGNAIKLADGWRWECTVTIDDDPIMTFYAEKTSSTKEEALEDMKKGIERGVRALEEKFKTTATCIDMKTHKIINWNK